VPVGKATIRFEFAYDGGGLSKGGTSTVFVNGKKVATGRIEKTQFAVFSADEGADVGVDEGTPVTENYNVPFKFTGKIRSVTIDVKEVKAANAETEQQSVREAHARKQAAD
jgi:arylsulfatase